MFSQNKLIAEHLKSGRPITPLEALNRYGCFRLGARILELRKEGIPIETEMIGLSNGKRIAQYKLKEEL
jgi:hypothetical protein